MAEPKTFAPRSDVVHTKLDSGAAVLLDLNTHKYFSLNSTGAVIWKMIESKTATDAIAAKLCEQFEIDQERAERSTQALVDQLLEAGLIEEAG